MEAKQIKLILSRDIKYFSDILDGILLSAEREPGAWVCGRQRAVGDTGCLHKQGRAVVDGLISGVVVPEFFSDARLSRIPKVIVTEREGVRMGGCCAYVLPDQEAVGRMAAEFYAGMGLGSVAVCGWAGHVYGAGRCAGFRERAAATRLTCPGYEVDFAVERGGNRIFDAKALCRWLEKLPKPCGLYAVNDDLASVLIRLGQGAGFKLAADIFVLGTDNEESLMPKPKELVSSVELGAHRIGERAWSVLKEMLAGGEAAPVTRIAPLQVVVRASVDPACGDAALGKARSFVQAHFRDAVGTEDIARAAGVSRRVLEQRCRRILGVTPKEMLEAVRLSEARKLLASTHEPVERIAEMAGFPDLKAFYRSHRSAFGETPGAIRRHAPGLVSWSAVDGISPSPRGVHR